MSQSSLIDEVREVAAKRTALKATITSQIEAARTQRREAEAKERELTEALSVLDGAVLAPALLDLGTYVAETTIRLAPSAPAVTSAPAAVMTDVPVPVSLAPKAVPNPETLPSLDLPTGSCAKLQAEQVVCSKALFVRAGPAGEPVPEPQPEPERKTEPGPLPPPAPEPATPLVSSAQRVTKVLQGGPMTAREVATATGMQVSAAAAALSALKGVGKAVHDPESHKYAIPSGAPMPMPPTHPPAERAPIITPPPAAPTVAPQATTTIDAICAQAGIEPPAADHPVRTRPASGVSVESEAKRVAVQAIARAEEKPAAKPTAPALPVPVPVPAKPSAAEKAGAAMTPQALVLEFLEEHGHAKLSEIVDHLVKRGRPRATAPDVVHGMFPDTIRKLQDRYYVPRKLDAKGRATVPAPADDEEDEDDDKAEQEKKKGDRR